ncbi:MAG TPA: hypothetical protein VF421_06085 [Niabella sp.]
MMSDIICRPHYSATVRAKSNADLIYKGESVLEEADESHYWLEVAKEAGLMQGKEGNRDKS